MTDLHRRVDLTVAFLVLAAIELRQLAGWTPDISNKLRHIAENMEAEADDLARRISD